MLSKLLHFREPGQVSLDHARAGIDPQRLCESRGWAPGIIQPCAGGTLSAAFRVQSARQALFLKTPLLRSGRAALLREARVLDALYGAPLGVEALEDPSIPGGRIWLKMRMLEPQEQTGDPASVLGLLSGLDLAAARRAMQAGCQAERVGFETLLTMAHDARRLLHEQHCLNDAALGCTDQALERLELALKDLQPQVCHGDLSPMNIMRLGSSSVAIDWEDSFVGVAHYDYLYWLSFYQNRRFYADAPLRCLDLDPDRARALLVMIVLLKCELAWRSGAWRHHTLGFSERLLEVATLH